MGSTSWRERGRCRGADPAIFYPDDDADGDDPAAEAKEICVCCPVREACLEHAIGTRERLGVWGGYTAKERRRLVRQRRRAS